MRATVLEGPRHVSVQDVPDPVLPGPAGIVIEVERTAICGSDLHLYHDAPTGAGIRLGHEAIGRVAELGPEVHGLARGDRVVVSGVIGCGLCAPCRAGQPNVCRNGKTAAFGTLPDVPGGQAEAMAVPFADLFALPIPEGVGRRGSRAPHRHPPHRLPGRAAGRHQAGVDRGRGRPGPRRDHGPQVRRAVRPGPHPGRRRGARAPGPGRARSAPSPSTPAPLRPRPRCSRPRADAAPRASSRPSGPTPR